MEMSHSPEYFEILRELTEVGRMTGKIGPDDIVISAEPRDVIEDGKAVKCVNWLITATTKTKRRS